MTVTGASFTSATYENAQPAADLACHLVPDTHASGANPLDDGPHRRIPAERIHHEARGY